MVVAVLFKAGAHVPLIPLLEVVGKAVKAAPEQIGATAVKVGVMFGFTVMVKVVVVAHCGLFSISEISSNEKSLPLARKTLSKISICAAVFEPEFH